MASISIIYVLLEEEVYFQDLKPYLSLLPLLQQHQVLRYSQTKDQILSLVSKLLLLSQASQDLQVPKERLHLTYSSLGKPYFSNYPTYHFSISHSKGCVAFVASDQPIGLDVEHVFQADKDIAALCFHPQEQLYFSQNDFSALAFYELWTQKEAYVKNLGTGMSTPLLSFNVREKSLKQSLWSTNLEGYFFSVCSNNIQEQCVNLKKLDLKELLRYCSHGSSNI